ncbi:MAG: CapA family protein [Actinomycetota bacterium]|nr:CapA family protein [Actinomycetota bacterium]
MRTPMRLLVATLLAAALLAACSGSEKADDETRSDGGSSTSAEGGSSTSADGGGTEPTESTDTTAAPRGPLGSGEAVTLAFAGDASFENLGQAVVADPQGLLSAIAPVLSAADVAVVNLETAVGSGGERAAKQFAFQVPVQALDALRAAGTDVVTMANNHGMDYGSGGLADTLRIKAETGFPMIGIGADDTEAYAPFITEVRGQRIGVIAANDIFDSNLVAAWTAGPGHPGIASAEESHQDQLAEQVRAVREQVDTLAVYLHYGTEKDTCPHGRQKELVELLVDAGADIVVGSHAHRLQGMGFKGDQFVAYGLSNFIFKAPSEPGRRSGVVTVTATGRRIDGYEWTPATIQNLVPVPLSGAAADAASAAMGDLQACAGLTPTPTGPGVEG